MACSVADSDRHGNHGISCSSQGERHNHLRDAVYATAASAHLTPTKEERALLPGTDGRAADVLVPNLLRGLHAALDITVINPLQVQTVQHASEEPGYALTLRHQQKWAKYGEKFLAEGIKFCPMVVEIIGGCNEEAVAILKRLGQALSRATGGDEGEVTRHMFGRLSILLQKDNATLLLNRIPAGIRAEVDGSL